MKKINKCIDCERKICMNSLRCWNCHKKSFRGKNNPAYIDGESTKQHNCIDCNKKISYWSWKFGSGLCSSCANKKENNPNFGKQTPEKVKIKMSNSAKNRWNDIEVRQNMSLAMGGTGIPYENSEYPQEFFEIRYGILKRDNFTCQMSG